MTSEISLSRVLVVHPLLQHAHQLAMGLHEGSMLQALWSGTPVLGPGEHAPSWMPSMLASRMRRVSIPLDMRRHPWWPQFAVRALSRLKVSAGGDAVHHVFHAFDRWTASRLERVRPSVIVAYENSAYHTFAEAKRLGITCVLDAPSLHHIPSDALIGTPSTPMRKEINRRKDVEVAQADIVLTCSQLAADSYAEQGVSHSKLRPVLLGADLSKAPGVTAQGAGLSVGPPQFVFAGGLTYRKSTDLILDAFEALAGEGRPFRLVFVGGCTDARMLARIVRLPGARHVPGVPQQELFAIFRESDCLLLPSRFDSFGMVVAEAMACGVPAIVSTRTGAKEIIERHPGSGWVVAPDAAAIQLAVRQLIDAPTELAAAKSRALTAAQEFTWAAYRARVMQIFRPLVAS